MSFTDQRFGCDHVRLFFDEHCSWCMRAIHWQRVVPKQPADQREQEREIKRLKARERFGRCHVCARDEWLAEQAA